MTPVKSSSVVKHGLKKNKFRFNFRYAEYLELCLFSFFTGYVGFVLVHICVIIMYGGNSHLL